MDDGTKKKRMRKNESRQRGKERDEASGKRDDGENAARPVTRKEECHMGGGKKEKGRMKSRHAVRNRKVLS